MFNFDYTSLFAGIPGELVVMLVSVVPIAELRVSIPLGLAFYNLNPFLTLVLAVIANIIPVIVILLLLEYVSDWLRKRSVFFENFFSKLFSQTHDKYYERFEVLGDILLVTLVAIPLPFTGAWTGALVAFLFDIPFPRALGFISLGVLIAGIIVTLASLGLISFVI